MLHTVTRNRKLATKRPADIAGHKRFWEMREKCATTDANHKIVQGERKVFRCANCGGVTKCDGDYGGEPDLHNCTAECQAATKALRASLCVTDRYRERYSEVQWKT